MGLPPLPKGASLVQGGGNPDPDIFKPLYDLGVQPTNGFRTPGDIKRLRAQGYKPAAKSRHLDGDAVDLTPGTSGLSMGEIQRRARALAQQHGYAVDGIFSEGDHVHAGMPGWGQAPGTPGTRYGGLPALPKGATLVQRGAIDSSILRPTGQVHDGDTFRLTNGSNARLFGADAFELGQMGQRNGQPVRLGDLSRNALLPFAVPSATVSPTGASTYGRPVATLNNGEDAGQQMIREGFAVAAPQYLKGNALLTPYMEAERQARLNRQGAWGGDFTMPDAHRHGAPDPWATAEASTDGKGVAYFADEPTPFQGLRPEIEKGYISIWQDMNSKPEDLLAYAAANGFTIDPKTTREQYAERNRTHSPSGKVEYQEPPRLLTDPGDGAVGTFARGFGDPLNLLDEAGGLANSLGVGGEDGPRENVWNSERRFGDILWNNIDQNRSILGHDDATHPYVRLGGQLASAVALPALGGARTVGALGRVGAVEGGLAGFGAGEGWGERFRQGTLGSVVGAAGGLALGGAGKAVAAGVGKVRGARLGDIVENGAFEAAPIVNDGVQNAGPTPAARYQPEGARTLADRVGEASAPVPPEVASIKAEFDDIVASSRPLLIERLIQGGKSPEEAATIVDDRLSRLGKRSAAMEADSEPMLLGPEMRLRDYIDLRDKGLGTFGNVRPMDERLGAGDMAKLFEGAQPGDVLPRPANYVESFEEAAKANPGTLQDLRAPNEMDALSVRRIPSPSDMFKSTPVRGPLDMTQRLRSLGGIQDQGGELSHLGIGAPRKLDHGGQESFLGRLVNDRGMTLDEATERLWEEGYFPEFSERPTPNDLLDRLREEAMGTRRYYHPDDLGELDAFDAARAERTRIERAQDEGLPLAERVGHEIDLNDLDANSPPLSAYEDAPRLTGKVGNINLDHIERPEDVSQLLQHITQRVGGFDAARRGKITHEETKALASELGMKPSELLSRQAGHALNAEQLFAARNMLQGSASVVVRLARKAQGGDADALNQLRNAMLRHTAIQEQVSGATAEAGRALSQLRMMATGKDANLRALKEFMAEGGEKETLEDAAQRIVDLVEAGTDAAGINKFVAAATKPGKWDKAVELYYNSLLSGPQTHAVNIVSNGLTAALSIPEHVAASALGQLRRGSVDRVMASELGPRIVGLMQGAMDGLKAARYTFKTGKVPDAVSKVEAAQQEAIGGKLGHFVRTPTRALSAEDEFFKAVGRRSELASLAVRKARGEGLKGDALKARVAELVKAPDAEMMEKAADFARYQTFQRPVGAIGQSIMNMTRNHPYLKLIAPFVRTPTNILKYATERSPAAPLLKEWRADMVAGGARRDLAIARATMGTGLGMLVADLAGRGLITGGGPADQNAKEALLADGWKPYSLKIGDEYVSYARLDPLATTLGIAADYVEKQSAMTERQQEQEAMVLTSAIISNLASKTWLSGVSDAVEALSDPMRYGPAYVRKIAAGVATPAIMGQTARTLDPTPRETHSVGDAIQARVPGLSDNLLPRLDAWGRPIVNEGGVGPDAISPAYQSSRKNDPINAEALRLGLTLSDPSRTVGGERLDDETFHAYRAQAGQLLAGRFRQLIASAQWKQMTDQQQVKAFDKLKREARAEVRGMLLGAGSTAPASVPPMPSGASAVGSSPAGLPPLPAGATMVQGNAAPPPSGGLPPLPPGAVMVQGAH